MAKELKIKTTLDYTQDSINQADKFKDIYKQGYNEFLIADDYRFNLNGIEPKQIPNNQLIGDIGKITNQVVLILTKNGLASGLHTHLLEDINDVTVDSGDFNRALTDIGPTVKALNLTTLTDGNNADTLHTHTVTSLTFGLTQGSVVFGSAIGGLGEDNSNFFWDDTNNRLGLGTSSPAVTLDVVGDIRIKAQGDVRFADSDSSNYAAIQAPAVIGSDYILTLPADDGDANEFLQTNGSGTLDWATPSIAIIFPWTEVTGTSQALAINNGYIANNAGLVTLTLPSTAAQGSIFKIVGKGAGLYKIAQNAGQTIHFGSTDDTTGATGSFTATNQYDAIEILCTTANTDFTVLSSIGSFTPA